MGVRGCGVRVRELGQVNPNQGALTTGRSSLTTGGGGGVVVSRRPAYAEPIPAIKRPAMAKSLIIPIRFVFIFFKTDLMSNLVGRLSDVKFLSIASMCQRNPTPLRDKDDPQDSLI